MTNICKYKDSDGSGCIRIPHDVGIHIVERDGKRFIAEGTIEFLQETAVPYKKI